MINGEGLKPDRKEWDKSAITEPSQNKLYSNACASLYRLDGKWSFLFKVTREVLFMMGS
jgi:hypothetical protein